MYVSLLKAHSQTMERQHNLKGCETYIVYDMFSEIR